MSGFEVFPPAFFSLGMDDVGHTHSANPVKKMVPTGVFHHGAAPAADHNRAFRHAKQRLWPAIVTILEILP